MIRLYDSDRLLIRLIAEYGSAITYSRFVQHSEWRAVVPASEYANVLAAKFAKVAGDDELYLVEWHDLVTADGIVEVGGRSATALLAERTVEGTRVWTDARPAVVVSGLVATLTGARSIAGLTVSDDSAATGTEITLQRSWGQMDEAIIDALSSAGDAGWCTRLDGTDIVISVLDSTTSTSRYGEKWQNSTGATKRTDKREWKNYAIVLGEGEGADRVRQDVDLTGADELRELYVDARDLQTENTTDIPFTAATDDSLTVVGHSFVVNNRVRISDISGGAPLANATDYWVKTVPTADTFTLAATLGGSVINITSAGSGRITTLEVTDAQYLAALDQRGREKLAEARLAETANALLASAIPAGTIITYESEAFDFQAMVTELVMTREKKTVTYEPKLGEPPARVKAAWTQGMGPAWVAMFKSTHTKLKTR